MHYIETLNQTITLDNQTFEAVKRYIERLPAPAKPAHTRGPWRVLPEEEGVPCIRVRRTVPGDKYKIANVICDKLDPPEESRANARMIAAAPELVETLEGVARTLEDALDLAKLPPFKLPESQLGRVRRTCERARAAVARATEPNP